MPQILINSVVQSLSFRDPKLLGTTINEDEDRSSGHTLLLASFTGIIFKK